MNKSVIRQFKTMEGKTFQYGGRIHYVLTVTIDEEKEKVNIKTNLDKYERSFENAEEFFSYWIETVNVSTPGNQNAVMVLEKEHGMVDRLTELLMDNISKVQQNKDYVLQAQTINNNVNSIINLTKLRLDVMRTAKANKI